ncbi:MAG: hypothetical protein Q9191_007451 [Dirinaria sp. TL-2023a]
MEADSSVQGGTHIHPVPPPLEFPFPRSSDEIAESTASPEAASDTVPANITGRHEQPYSEDQAISHPPAVNKKASTATVPNGRNDSSRNTLLQGTNHHQKPDKGLLPADEKPKRPKQPHSYTSARLRRNKSSGVETGASASCRRGADDDTYGKFSVGNDDFRTKGKVDKTSGRLDISINETSNRGYLAKALGASLHRHLDSRFPQKHTSEQQPQAEPTASQEGGLRRPDLHTKVSTSLGVPTIDDFSSIPVLNIVIMVIGSRGDIQPFLRIGKVLKETYRHRVRIATHPAFKTFVEKDSGLEFFSVGGDPSELMSFMVKNPGLIPSMSTVKSGEIRRRRESMFEMFKGFWRACVNATDDETIVSNRKMMEDAKPFVADAIIANPPSFAHIHCAERLGVPLHLMFTFPYSPTQQFPHPLANIKASNVDANYINFMSYPLVEMMTWQGLGDLVNQFRVKTLGLEPVSTLWAPGQLFRLKVPYTYLWSPSLIPKPPDWGDEIDIAGFIFLDLASSFRPPESLSKFLESGPPPVYIGFGSIVIDDPDQFTNLIFEAVEKAGVRALVSKGWGGLGGEENVPDNIYLLENTPHDWLFPRVSAVVHHGGAGTTAIGLKCGIPTMIVPFFGDQPFWGAMVSKARAGAHRTIPYKDLTVDALADGIQQCLTAEAKSNAQKIARSIAEEGDGAQNCVESFHRHLPLRGEPCMRCTVFQDRVAVWRLKDSRLRLSALAAQIFVDKKKFRWQDLRLIRHYDWSDFEGPGEPLTGAGAALANTAAGFVKGVGGVPVKWAKSLKRREKIEKRREGADLSSGPATNSQSQPGSPRSLHSHEAAQSKAYKEKGELPQGGKHGAEQHLPEPNTQGDILGPIPSEPRSDEDDAQSDGSEEGIAQELAEETRTGIAKSGRALAKAPMDLSLAIAQGFHNAPRLYGDETVRTPVRITGFHSGLRAAGEGFTFGIYDGVTGLVLQPYHGAKENGPIGFVQGLGKGFGGFVLKDLAAIFGPVGFTLKGVHKEMIKNKQPTAFIRRSHIKQGRKDLAALDDEQQREVQQMIDTAWKVLEEIKNEQDIVRSEGAMGRIKVKRTKRNLNAQGAFESVPRAKKVVEDRKMNRFLEDEKKQNAAEESRTREQTEGQKKKEKTSPGKRNRLVKFEKAGNGSKKPRSSSVKGPPQVDGVVDEEGESNHNTTEDNTNPATPTEAPPQSLSHANGTTERSPSPQKGSPTSIQRPSKHDSSPERDARSSIYSSYDS